MYLQHFYKKKTPASVFTRRAAKPRLRVQAFDGLDGAVLVQEDDGFRLLGELEHVLGAFHHAGRDGRLPVGRVGGAAVFGEVVLVALDLAAPDAA